MWGWVLRALTALGDALVAALAGALAEVIHGKVVSAFV